MIDHIEGNSALPFVKTKENGGGEGRENQLASILRLDEDISLPHASPSLFLLRLVLQPLAPLLDQATPPFTFFRSSFILDFTRERGNDSLVG